jgi:hypothetical protein
MVKSFDASSKKLPTTYEDPEAGIDAHNLDFWDGVHGLIKIQNVSPLYEKNQFQDHMEIKDKAVIDLKVSNDIL